MLGIGGVTCADLLPPMNGDPGDFAPRRAGAAVDAHWRIPVATDGLYRLTYADLAVAGITNVAGDTVRLFCCTQEIALYISCGSAFMNTNDYLLFYGQGYNGYYTSSNVYWLGFGGAGLRMGTRPAPPIGAANEVTTHVESVIYNPDQVYHFINYRPTESAFDHWYATAITNGIFGTFPLTTDSALSAGTAAVTVALSGITTVDSIDPDHRTSNLVNGVYVTNYLFDGQSGFTGMCAFTAALITGAMTRVQLTQTLLPGVANDRVYLDRITLDYPRRLTTRNRGLTFRGIAGTNNYLLSGFHTNTILRALDISIPANPVILTNLEMQTVGTNAQVRWGDVATAASRYTIVEEAAILNIPALEPVVFRDLADTNRQADFILICPYEFRRNAYRLLKYRRLRGLNVAVAPITDIYNEFSYGIKDAAAIKQFIGYAFHHWQAPPPSYVVLAGEGTYDPKNNLKVSAPADWIPVHLDATSYAWTALDGWFATVNGSDALPDVALGRIPVTTDVQLSNVVDKLIQYEAWPATNAWRKKALAVADNYQAPYDFKASSETNVVAFLTNHQYAVQKAYIDDSGPLTHDLIMNSWNGGIFSINYLGHGSLNLWAAEQILRTNDIAALTNTVYPMVTVFTCENGMFHVPTNECIAEVMVERAQHGAVGCIAPSSFSIGVLADTLANGYYEALVNTQQFSRVGEVMDQSLLTLWGAYGNVDELLYYEVFGDPALIIKPSP
jgi:hypothetical protein